MEPIVVHLDPEFQDLIPGFLSNRRLDVASLVDAAGSGDFEAVLRIGHSLKGVGGGFGFDEITELGRQLEIAGRARRTAAVCQLIESLRAYLDRVEVVFDEES